MIGKNKRAELSLALKGRLMRGLGNSRRGLGAREGRHLNPKSKGTLATPRKVHEGSKVEARARARVLFVYLPIECIIRRHVRCLRSCKGCSRWAGGEDGKRISREHCAKLSRTEGGEGGAKIYREYSEQSCASRQRMPETPQLSLRISARIYLTRDARAS